MNAIFTAVFLISSALIIVINPQSFLPSLLGGAESGLKCCLTLFCVYAVWMGLSAVAEDAGVNRKAAKLLKPLCGRVFKTQNEAALENVSMNLSCNLLGIGGAATPFAVKAVNEFEKDKNRFAQNLLFIINATSVQLIPTTVITLRASAGSANANDIILPCLITTVVSTGLATAIYFAVNKLWRM